MHNNHYMLQGCGQPVDGMRVSLRTTARLVHSSHFWTQYVPNLWVTNGFYTSFMRSAYTQLLDKFSSVNSYLYPLSTAPTIETSFSNQNISFNNKHP